MKLLNLFAVKNQVHNSLSGDFRRLKQAGNEALHTISGGRSMVEMLGVLAIIGVLSVGAISGYNTAMYKHRMNKTIHIFSDFLFNLIELSNKKGEGYGCFSRGCILAYHLLTEEQCPVSTRDSWYCKFPVGDFHVVLYPYDHWEDLLQAILKINFYEGDIVRSCVDFLSQGWQNIFPPEWYKDGMGFIGVYGKGDKGLWAGDPKRYYGDAKKDNITLSDIQTACDACKEVAECSITMYLNYY